MRPVMLVKSGGLGAMPEWQALFAEYLPVLDVRHWDDPQVDPSHVRYALVWQPEPGRLASYPGLRMVLSSANGVDHVTCDPQWPRHLPLLRAATGESAQRMGEYVCMAVLGLSRDLPRLVAQQRAGRWESFDSERGAPETVVGILGLGRLGSRSAAMLGGLGFQVLGWSRSPKQLPGVTSHTGQDGLVALLEQAHIVVCMLPATPDTDGLLNRASLARLRPGAGLVHVGRGSHIVERDLLEALDSGQLGGAVLDVFQTEPLPPDHPLWHHPKVIITPHQASIASRRARVQHFARQIEAHTKGEPLEGVYDAALGY